MITYNNLLAMGSMEISAAALISKLGHANQKYGKHDYFQYHIIGVVNVVLELYKTHPNLKQLIICALKHDLIEDCDILESDIISIFGNDIAHICKLLTRTSDVSKVDYIKNIKGNEIARLVKIADSTFNMRQCELEGNCNKKLYYSNIVNELSDI